MVRLLFVLAADLLPLADESMLDQPGSFKQPRNK